MWSNTYFICKKKTWRNIYFPNIFPEFSRYFFHLLSPVHVPRRGARVRVVGRLPKKTNVMNRINEEIKFFCQTEKSKQTIRELSQIKIYCANNHPKGRHIACWSGQTQNYGISFFSKNFLSISDHRMISQLIFNIPLWF